MDREHGTLTARIAEALEELRTGESEERTGREALSRIGRECLSVHRDEMELRRKLEEERGRVRRGRLRLERLHDREGKASASLASLGGEIAGTTERLSAVQAERGQLIELWDDKYPYNAAEAGEVEGGREQRDRKSVV